MQLTGLTLSYSLFRYLSFGLNRWIPCFYQWLIRYFSIARSGSGLTPTGSETLTFIVLFGQTKMSDIRSMSWLKTRLIPSRDLFSKNRHRRTKCPKNSCLQHVKLNVVFQYLYNGEPVKAKFWEPIPCVVIYSFIYWLIYGFWPHEPWKGIKSK